MLRSKLPAKWADVLVGIGVVLFISAFGLCAIEGGRSVAKRAKCQANLHQIGLAILLYQNDNQQRYPSAVADTTGDPKPTWGTPYQGDKDLGPVKNVDPFAGGKNAPAVNDVTASFFLLIRNEQITPQVFICPDTRLKPWDFGGGAHTAQDWVNWAGNDGLAQHLSYSYQNPFASNAAIAAGFQMKNPDATFAIASDMNPGGDAVLNVKPTSAVAEMQAANSLNHNQTGQNVLYGDGHAEWENNCFCGSMHDNIYTAAGPEVKDEAGRGKAVVVASSVGPMDSILLPSAADIGYKGSPPPKPMNPADVAKLEKDIQGTYNAKFPSRKTTKGVLVIDDKTIKCTAGPLTILYNYEVTGSDDGALLLNLTAPDSKETARISLEGAKLNLEMSGDFSLEFPWQRVDAPLP